MGLVHEFGRFAWLGTADGVTDVCQVLLLLRGVEQSHDIHTLSLLEASRAFQDTVMSCPRCTFVQVGMFEYLAKTLPRLPLQ
jgi:hypothetical protein